MFRPPAVHIPVRLRTKLYLILLGIFLSFLILEVLLRAGGFALLAVREYKNLKAAKQKGVYRIMCVGESTTQDQYPPFLSEILNERGGNKRFAVFDKGVVATNTDEILSRLESDLDECQPDMVIAMIGINDWGFAHLQKEGFWSRAGYFLRSLRVYKLARYMRESLSERVNKLLAAGDIPVRFGNRRIRFSTYLELARDYKDRGKIDKAREFLEKAVAQDPQNDMAYFELGRIYRLLHDFVAAENAYKKLREINPRHVAEYKDLKWVYSDEQSFARAEEALKKSLMMNPLNDWLLGALATAYEESGRHELAQEYYDRADNLRKIYRNPRTIITLN